MSPNIEVSMPSAFSLLIWMVIIFSYSSMLTIFGSFIFNNSNPKLSACFSSNVSLTPCIEILLYSSFTVVKRYWTCSATPLVASQVLQNTAYFADFSGSCSETEVSEQLYCMSYTLLALYRANAESLPLLQLNTAFSMFIWQFVPIFLGQKNPPSSSAGSCVIFLQI